MKVQAAPREDNLGLGFAMMVAAVFCFTAIDASAKVLLLSGFAAIQVVFVRYAGHFLMSLVLFLPGAGLSAFRSERPVVQILRTCFLAGGTLFNFLALRSLPISVTTTIFFAAPILVSVLGIPILGEKVGLRRFLAILTGFLGVVVVIQPWGTSFDPALLLSLAALTCASLYFVMTRLIAGIETNAASQLWSSGLPTLVLLVPAILSWQWPETGSGYFYLIGIGIWGVAGHSALTTANRFADASVLAPMIYVQLIFATLAGYFLFDTLPTQWTLVGGLIIIASGVYIWARERASRAR